MPCGQSFKDDIWLSFRNDICTLSLKWYMTVSSKGATAPSIILKWYINYRFEMTFRKKLSFARLGRVPSVCLLNPDQIQSVCTRLKKSLLIFSRWSMTFVSKWAAAFCVRFDMIYDCHFEMTAQNFRTEDYFRQEKCPAFSWRKSPITPIFSYTDFFAATVP